MSSRFLLCFIAGTLLLSLSLAAYVGFSFFLIVLQTYAIFAGAGLVIGSMLAYLLTVTSSLTDRLEKTDHIPGSRGGAGQWAGENNFELAGYYIQRFGRNQMCITAWRHRERPTFFYTLKSPWCDPEFYLTTLFADRAYLTTGTSSQMLGLCSPPWAYNQIYSGKSPEELWERHLEGENYLIDEGEAERVAQDVRFEEWFVGRKDEQVAHMRSIPFWPFRIYGWIFRNIRMGGVSIQRQYERGWIRLPNKIQSEQ